MSIYEDTIILLSGSSGLDTIPYTVRLPYNLTLISLNFDDFIARNYIHDEKEDIQSIVKYLDKVTTWLVEELHTGLNRIRYLRNAVLCKKYVIT